MGKYLYVGTGAKLWKILAEHEPAYPLSRAGAELVRKALPELARRLPRGLTMVDLAPGGTKSVIASAEIGRAIGIRRYHAIEGSPEFCKSIPALISSLLPEIEIGVIVDDMFEPIQEVKTERALAYLGGITISNLIHPMDPVFPAALLADTLGKLLRYSGGGWLLLTIDTMNDRAELDARYKNKTTEAFATDLMKRAAVAYPALGLVGDGFKYDPEYIETSQQYAQILEATVDQACSLWRIARGDRFHIANSYKIAPGWFERAVREIGASVVYMSLDRATGLALYLVSGPNARDDR